MMRLTTIEDCKVLLLFDYSIFCYGIYHSRIENKKKLLLERLLSFFSLTNGLPVAPCFVMDPLTLDRKSIDPLYKSNRPTLDVNPKEEYLDFTDKLPFYKISSPREEADDVFATIAEMYPDKGIVIVSNDSDLIHLTDKENAYMVSAINGTEIKTNSLLEKNKLKARHISAFKAIFGDSSDAVPPIVKRLRRKDFVDLIYLHFDNEDALIHSVLERLFVVGKVSRQDKAEIFRIKDRFKINWALVTPRRSIPLEIEKMELDESIFEELPPYFYFLTSFLKGEPVSEEIL